jgi:hypothetical protein
VDKPVGQYEQMQPSVLYYTEKKEKRQESAHYSISSIRPGNPDRPILSRNPPQKPTGNEPPVFLSNRQNRPSVLFTEKPSTHLTDIGSHNNYLRSFKLPSPANTRNKPKQESGSRAPVFFLLSHSPAASRELCKTLLKP